MANPPVVPFPPLQPWGQPQTLEQWPRAAGPQASMVGRGGPSAMPTAQAAPIRDPHHYALLNGSASFGVDTNSILILASPPTYRNFLVIRNIGATNLYVDFGTNADANRTPIRLVTNAILIFDSVVPQDDIFCISDAVGGIVGLSYSNVVYSGVGLLGPTT
jgi:hypothetical protein